MRYWEELIDIINKQQYPKKLYSLRVVFMGTFEQKVLGKEWIWL